MQNVLNPTVWLPVKVLTGKKMLPNKEALDDFYNTWKSSRHGTPFTGEFNTPATNDVNRLLTVDPHEVSHCITDIDMSTYDKKKSTVMMKVRFTGPRGDEAFDDCIANRVRFITRAVNVNGKDRIVTFDLMHAPAGVKSKKSIIKAGG